MIEFIIVLLAGVVTVASPCVLPLLPVILGTGIGGRSRFRPIAIVSGFVFGFTVFALLFAAFGTAFGLNMNVWRTVAALAIILFGIMMVWPRFHQSANGLLRPILAKLRPSRPSVRDGLWGAFVLGLSLGIVWTPCSGPALGAVLALTASKQDLIWSAALLAAFSIGAGIPMLLIAYGGRAAVNKVRRLVPHAITIQRVFGVVIILVGLCLVTKFDLTVQHWLFQHYPEIFFRINRAMCSG